MKRSMWRFVLIAALLTLAAVPAAVNAAPSTQTGQNLLLNPGFESPYNSDGAAGSWVRWHQDSGDLCTTKPEDWNFACKPSWSQELDVSRYGLTRSGTSQHIGVQYMPWHAGVWQTVNVAPGSRVRFSVWGYSRASNEQPPAPSVLDRLPRMQVGIDPNGNGQWNNPGVIWSAEVNALDSWQQLSIEATVGAAGKVTVFVSSNFRLIMPLAHMDSWWDDAMLQVITEATPAPTSPPPPPPAPTSPPGPPPPPPATSTPRPDGSIVHVVRSGDTLSSIALQYNVPLEQIQRLNATSIGPNNLIVVGQELVIALPAVPPTPTTPPQPPTPEASPTSPTASVCVLAYHDRNGDTFRQVDSEEMLPNAVFLLGTAIGLVGQYTTDGLSEPYCFTNLPIDTYRLILQPPPGYVGSGPSETMLGVGSAVRMDIAMGARRSEGTPTPVVEQPGGGGGEARPVNWAGLLRAAIGVAGLLMLMLAVVVLVIFLTRRR
jgi:LysM repeat protein